MNTLAVLLAASLQSAAPQPRPAAAPQARLLHPQKRSVAPPPLRRPSFPPVEIFAVNLNETLRYRPFDEHGRARKPAERQLTRLLRCWHTGKQRRVDPRLGRVLYEVARHYPERRLEIFSGYRPPAYCTRAHSRHLSASAIDFRVAGVSNEALVKWLRGTFHPVGVGYYPNGVHVHLDVDRTVDTYWVDAGDGPGIGGPTVALGDPGLDAPADEPRAASDEAAEATADEPIGAEAPVPRPSDPPESYDPPDGDPALD
jgi:uncharacterized protein YcbK (DUF882 family)